MTTIAVDVMGGDYGIPEIIPACVRALAKHKDLYLLLVGLEENIKAALSKETYDSSRITVVHATEKVDSDEPPAKALRSKKDSSMRVAINCVQDGRAEACVSAGNTGALMATARFVLKTLPGIDRPAIIAPMPTRQENKSVRMLDLGANVDCTGSHLYEFAVMGSILTSAVEKIARPRVSLLNIGSEAIKGNEQVKKAAELLEKTSWLNYIGFIEPHEIFSNKTDVIVCDGFVGNVALKTTEGVARLIKLYLQQVFTEGLIAKILALFAAPALRKLKYKLDPNRRNGATMVGLNGIVVKSHGGADRQAFASAIEVAIMQIKHNVPQLIRARLEEALEGK
jgi:glycerol-3-phosphate acyltransferase PlsX